MAYRGQVIYNPVTREQFTILKTSEDTNGESLLFECRVAPGGAVLPGHVHETQEERFEIISGTLGVMVGGEKRTLRAGDRVILPARVKHQWWNAGDDEVAFLVEVVPARNLESTLELLAALAHAGKLNGNAMPKNPFYLVQVGRLSETYLPVIPIWMQKIGLTMGYGAAWWFGFDHRLARYQTATIPAGATSEAA